MHLPIFQPNDILNLHSHINEFHPICGYKDMFIKTECTSS